MSKIDYKKELKELYRPPAKKVVEVNVPQMNFLMIDGTGLPDEQSPTTEFGQAIEALFSVSYKLKFMIRNGQGMDYGVLPLEGLWWADDMSDFIKGNKSKWKWTAMIMQPGPVTKKLVNEAIKQVQDKKDLPSVDRLRFKLFKEGPCAQILHIGPFSEEGPVIEQVHSFISKCGRKPAGKHHEIYLSDIRRVAPENMKTVIRQPMK